MKTNNLKVYLAEFIGTFALVFCGTGSIIVNTESNGSVGLVGIALAFGFVITAMIYVFGKTSGTHINPAVTIALVVGKVMPIKRAFYYIITQVLGAISASVLLKFMFPQNVSLGATMPSGSITQSFIMEVVATFILMIVIFRSTAKENDGATSLTAIIIGTTVTGLIFVTGPISGGSFNPARSIGPALISGDFTALWVYLTAPVLGAVLAAFCWKIIRED